MSVPPPPRTFDRLRQFLLAHPWPLLAIIYLLYNAIRFMLIRDFSEWEAVYVFAARQLLHGQNIYRLLPQQRLHLYAYPPFQAFAAIPFTFLPRYVGRFLWFLINAAAILGLWRWSWRLSGGRSLRRASRRENLICLLGILCTTRFIQDGLDHQQTDIVIGAIAIAGILALSRSRPFAAATLWGIAAAFKGPPLLFAPYLLWRRKWLPAIWVVIVAIALNLLPNLVHRAPTGLWLLQWYRDVLAHVQRPGQWFTDPLQNQSIAGDIYRFTQIGWRIDNADFIASPKPTGQSTLDARTVIDAIELALIALAAAALRPRSSDAPIALQCALVLILMLLLSPMSGKPHFCVLVLPAFLVARRALEHRDRIAQIAIVLSILLVLLLDRNYLGRLIGNGALYFGSITAAALLLYIACIRALLQGRPLSSSHTKSFIEQ